MDFDLDFDLDFEEEGFDEDLFCETDEHKSYRFDLEESIEKLEKNKLILDENCSLRMISPTKGFSSCSLLCAMSSKIHINDLKITTLRVGKKELDKIVDLKKMGKIDNVELFLCDIAKENKQNGKDYKYSDYFDTVCNKNQIKYKYIKNHSKVILIDSDKGKIVIETSSNFNENPKIEQFIVTKSEKVYDYYISVFSKLKLFEWEVTEC